MSPADHYAAAETLIYGAGNAAELGERMRIIAEAQVHATLATVPAMVVQQQRLDTLQPTPDGTT